MKYVQLHIDDVVVEMPEGSSVAAAILANNLSTRGSTSGECRAPLCGMGVCFECRVQIDGETQVRACLTAVRAGMQVRTHEHE